MKHFLSLSLGSAAAPPSAVDAQCHPRSDHSAAFSSFSGPKGLCCYALSQCGVGTHSSSLFADKAAGLLNGGVCGRWAIVRLILLNCEAEVLDDLLQGGRQIFAAQGSLHDIPTIGICM